MNKKRIYLIILLVVCSALKPNIFAEEKINNFTFEVTASPEYQKELDSVQREQNNNNTDKILQLMENILSYVNIALLVVTFLLSMAGFIFGKVYWEVQKSLKLQKKKAKEEEEKSYRQHEEVDIKIQEAKSHLNQLDITDVLTTTKISAIQQSLVLCLEKAPTRDVAFATYSKLLTAYEVLLNDISKVKQEEMEMAATIVHGNRKYVPDEIIHFLIEHMNLPYKVRGILWGKS